MKKALSLILALVMCLSLCACGGSDEVELTLDNYATYLDINSGWSFGAKVWGTSDQFYEYQSYSTEAYYKVKATGTSSNYDFNDVTITIRVTGTYDTYNRKETTEDIIFNEEITISCNIGGSGAGEATVFKGFDSLSYDRACYIHTQSASVYWEVVSISGTVTRIG